MYNYNETEQKVAYELMKIGLPISSKGFNYFITGTILAHEDKMGICNIYKVIAEKYNTTVPRVERCIRADIIAYYDNIIHIPSLLECDYFSGKLTNKEFLYRLAYMLNDILKDNTNKS